MARRRETFKGYTLEIGGELAPGWFNETRKILAAEVDSIRMVLGGDRVKIVAVTCILRRKDEARAKGGKARAKKLTAKRRKEIAVNAANARWGNK